MPLLDITVADVTLGCYSRRCDSWTLQLQAGLLDVAVAGVTVGHSHTEL